MPGDSLYINNKAVKQNTYDAIVIGSGISGGWAVKELCEKGLKTLALERGRNVQHIKDYTDTSKDPWELPHRGGVTVKVANEYPVQRRVYNFDEVSKHFYVNDQEHPYTQDKPFPWIRGYQVGGRSLVWGRQCYRFGDLEFNPGQEGMGQWPIRYKDLASWYDHVEKFVGISGTKENLPQLPDGVFLPPMEMNCVEKHLAEKIREQYGNERRLIIGRVANLTRPLDDRGPCQYRNKCHRGCPFGGYFSSNSATLPAARKTGNLTIRPFSIVTEIIYDKEKKRASGVRIIDAETMLTEEYYARVIFLNASTINSAAILLQSVSDAFPQGLGNSSGHVGHNLMTHHIGAGAEGIVEGFEDKYYYGGRPNICYVPRFRNISASSKRKDYIGGYAFQSGCSRDGWGSAPIEPNIGAAYKESLTEPGSWRVELGGFGEMLPYYDNKITLNHAVRDKWGLPTVSIDCSLKENEWAMRRDMRQTAEEMLERIGVKNIIGQNTTGVDQEKIFSVHEMGTAKMGRDPKTSVLNGNNQLHDAPNVFITDGSCMTTSACQNPSLTYMAITARACDFAVRTFR